jgi:hypothetical protein
VSYSHDIEQLVAHKHRLEAEARDLKVEVELLLRDTIDVVLGLARLLPRRFRGLQRAAPSPRRMRPAPDPIA